MHLPTLITPSHFKLLCSRHPDASNPPTGSFLMIVKCTPNLKWLSPERFVYTMYMVNLIHRLRHVMHAHRLTRYRKTKKKKTRTSVNPDDADRGVRGLDSI